MDIPTGPHFVARLPATVSGIDFLGLGAVTDRLAALVFPGINNVTRHIRPYSMLAWIAWKFEEYVKDQPRGLTAAEIRERFRAFREKVELLFTWSNQETGERGIIGTRRNFPEHDRIIDLSFADIGTEIVSWLDAVNYGPSLKADSGLGFAQTAKFNTLRPTLAGTELAQGLDRALRRSSYYDKLADVESPRGRLSMAKDLAKRWQAAKPTTEERECFRRALCVPGVDVEGTDMPSNRKAAVRLVLRAIRANGGHATIEDVRETIARGVARGGRPLDSSGVEKTRVMWATLQLRQLERLSLEALLRWFELMLFSPPVEVTRRAATVIADFGAGLAADELGLARDDPIDKILRQIETKAGKETNYYVAGLGEEEIDVFSAIQQILVVARTEDEVARLPGLALHGLALSALQTRFLASQEYFPAWLQLGGRPRLSLATMAEVIDQRASDTVEQFFQFAIETLVIGQHFATAAARLEPDKNKYRFLPEEDGYRLLLGRDREILRLGVTADRLETAMSLMCECGLLESDGLPGDMETGFRLGPAAKELLN